MALSMKGFIIMRGSYLIKEDLFSFLAVLDYEFWALHKYNNHIHSWFRHFKFSRVKQKWCGKIFIKYSLLRFSFEIVKHNEEQYNISYLCIILWRFMVSVIVLCFCHFQNSVKSLSWNHHNIFSTSHDSIKIW